MTTEQAKRIVDKAVRDRAVLANALGWINRACERGADQSDDEMELFIANVREISSIALARAGGI